jgi:hypothetical protein
MRASRPGLMDIELIEIGDHATASDDDPGFRTGDAAPLRFDAERPQRLPFARQRAQSQDSEPPTL